MQEIQGNPEAFIAMFNEAQPGGAPAPSSGGLMPSIPGMGETPSAAAVAQQLPQIQQMLTMLPNLPQEQQNQILQSLGITMEQAQQLAQMAASMTPETLQQLAGAGGQMPPQGATTVQLTQEEAAAVSRLCEMGFERSDVIQAFLACEKNESLAANFLLESQMRD